MDMKNLGWFMVNWLPWDNNSMEQYFELGMANPVLHTNAPYEEVDRDIKIPIVDLKDFEISTHVYETEHNILKVNTKLGEFIVNDFHYDLAIIPLDPNGKYSFTHWLEEIKQDIGPLQAFCAYECFEELNVDWQDYWDQLYETSQTSSFQEAYTARGDKTLADLNARVAAIKLDVIEQSKRKLSNGIAYLVLRFDCISDAEKFRLNQKTYCDKAVLAV